MADRHLILIIPKLLNSTLLFTCQITDPVTGEKVSLIDKGKNGQVKIGELDPTDRVKQIPMNVRTRIEFDFDKDDLKSQDTKNYVSFWSKDNALIQRKGSLKNSATAYLIIEDLTETKSAKVVSNKDIRKAMQKFETFGSEGNLRGWKNIAYYFGVPSADKLDYDDLYLLLVDAKDGGLLLQPENIQRFLNYNSNDFNTQLAINTSRAIEKGFIEKRSDSGSGDSYYINNHPVGKTESDVIVYLEANKDFYFNYVVEKLGDEAEKEKEVRKEFTDKKIETIDIEGVRARCKELFETLKEKGVKGSKASRYAQFVTVEKIQEAIDEAEILLAERSGGIGATIETTEKAPAIQE